ncbi:hypothetical protein SDC9_11403 [bioreactor metagenome]|uniref:Uncharacterized protein n=1 Tax=bioreactor metagenome TaxID=1076179 RepID=A0A644TGA9_9ZZZZ
MAPMAVTIATRKCHGDGIVDIKLTKRCAYEKLTGTLVPSYYFNNPYRAKKINITPQGGYAESTNITLFLSL